MSRTLPGLSLTGGYADAEHAWGSSMNANLLKLSTLVGGIAAGVLAAVPGSPTPGTVVILNAAHGTHPNAVAVWDGPPGSESWTYFAPATGWILWNSVTSEHVTFSGTAWVSLGTGGGGSLPVGGDTGDVLTKLSATDGDADWVAPTAGGGEPFAWVVTATGTGSSQDITIPYSGIALRRIMVFSNGLKVPIADLSLLGTTLTGTFPSSADIEILGPTGSGNPASTKWRLYVTDYQGGALVSIGELHLYDEGSSSNIAGSATITQSSQYASFGPTYVNNNNLSDFSSLQVTSPLPGWWEAEFSSPVAIAGMGVAPRGGELDNSPKDFKLQFWDGSGWVDHITVTGETSWTASVVNTYDPV